MLITKEKSNLIIRHHISDFHGGGSNKREVSESPGEECFPIHSDPSNPRSGTPYFRRAGLMLTLAYPFPRSLGLGAVQYSELTLLVRTLVQMF